MSFYRVQIDVIDLKSMFDSLLPKLLLLRFRQSYFSGLLEIEMLRFDIILLMKLLLYYRQRVSQFLGSRNRAYLSYFMKFQFMTSTNFFTLNLDAFSVISECSQGFIRLFYQIIPKYFIFLPFSLSSRSLTSEKLTSDSVTTISNDSSQLPQKDLNKFLYPPTNYAPWKLA